MEEWRSRIEVYKDDTEPGISIEQVGNSPGLHFEILSRTASVLLPDEDEYELTGVEVLQISDDYFRLTGRDTERDVAVSVEVLESKTTLEIVSVTSTDALTGVTTTLFRPTAH